MSEISNAKICERKKVNIGVGKPKVNKTWLWRYQFVHFQSEILSLPAGWPIPWIIVSHMIRIQVSSVSSIEGMKWEKLVFLSASSASSSTSSSTNFEAPKSKYWNQGGANKIYLTSHNGPLFFQYHTSWSVRFEGTTLTSGSVRVQRHPSQVSVRRGKFHYVWRHCQ